MSNSLKISIVTISYNQGRFLKQCIDSVLSQNYDNFEYFILDNCSNDNSSEILKQLKLQKDNRVKIIEEKDNGPANALNKGFKMATGDIYYFLNSDDYLVKDTFKYVVDQFNKNPKIDILFGSGYLHDEINNQINIFFPNKVNKKLFLKRNVCFFQQGMFFKSNIYNKTKGFNEINKSNWDAELFLDMLHYKPIIKRSFSRLAIFRIHELSISSQKINIDQNRIYGLEEQTLLKKIFNKIILYLHDPLWVVMTILKKIKVLK